jgi:hypothetical protein
MQRLVRMLCCLIFFLLPLRSWGSPAHPELAPITADILTLCGNCQVLVLGETHQKPESPVLFIDLVTHLIAKGERVLVGLEVSADQQDALDAVMVGNRTPEGIAHPIIDSPAFQKMLVDLSELNRTHGLFITLAAIDARDHERVRDATMARHIGNHLASGQFDRIVVLVGNLHTIRKMHWTEDAGSQAPFLAERLVEAGVHVTSVMQELDAECGGLKHPTFYPMSDRNGLAAIRRQVDTIKPTPCGRPSRLLQ